MTADTHATTEREVAQLMIDALNLEVPEGKTLAIHLYGLDLPAQWRYTFDLETGEVSPFKSGMRAPASTSNANK